MPIKQFRAVILYPSSHNVGPDGTDRIIDATSEKEARKIAKRLAEEMNGRVFSLDRIPE